MRDGRDDNVGRGRSDDAFFQGVIKGNGVDLVMMELAAFEHDLEGELILSRRPGEGLGDRGH